MMNLARKEFSIKIAVGWMERCPGNYLKKVMFHA